MEWQTLWVRPGPRTKWGHSLNSLKVPQGESPGASANQGGWEPGGPIPAPLSWWDGSLSVPSTWRPGGPRPRHAHPHRLILSGTRCLSRPPTPHPPTRATRDHLSASLPASNPPLEIPFWEPNLKEPWPSVTEGMERSPSGHCRLTSSPQSGHWHDAETREERGIRSLTGSPRSAA